MRNLRTSIVAALASIALATPAFAGGNLVMLGQNYPTTKCGLYYGANAEGAGSNVNGAPPGTTQIGGDVGLVVGYACPVAGIPFFVEGIFDFQNLNASSAGFALSGPAHLEQRVAIQTPLLQFLPALGVPSTGTVPSLPVLPPGVTVNGATQNYIYGSVSEDDISATVGIASGRQWLVYSGFGTGLLTPIKLSNGWNAVIDTWAGLTLQSSQICVNGAVGCQKLGTGFRTGVSFKF